MATRALTMAKMAPTIQISRVSDPVAHRRRAYEVLIDGQRAGTLTKADWLGSFEVSAGRHLVQIRSGRLASQVIAVTVADGLSTSLTCSARPVLEGAWTSISDIGREFEDGVLSRHQYQETEDAYLDAVKAFAHDSGATHLQVRDPENRKPRRGEPRPRHLVHGEMVPISVAVEIVREMLREQSWCRLESLADDFTVHVGDDYYLYIASTQPCARAVAEVDAGRLFVEPFAPDDGSPYIPKDGRLKPYPGPHGST